MNGRLLLIVVVGFASGIACRSLFSIPWEVIALTAVAGILTLAFWFQRNATIYSSVSIFILCVVFGMGRAAFVQMEAPGALGAHYDTNVEIVGTIVADPDIRETTQRLTVAVTDGLPKTRVLIVAPLYPTYAYGAQVRVAGKLEQPEPFDTDGGRVFRYDRFLAKDGVFGIMRYTRMEALAEPGGLHRALGYLYSAKHAFTNGLAAALPEPTASLAAGIITGGKQGLGQTLLDAFTVAGLLPVVVLSGYNVMIVADGVRRLFGFLPKRFALGTAAVAVLLFVLAAGSGPSAVRAGLAAGVALYARATGRTYSALRALGAIWALMLLVNPLLLVADPGFQFSFAATLGLIIGTPIIEPYLVRVRGGILREVIATTIAAQLFVLPLLLYQTGNLSLVALPANILVLPVVPLAMFLSALAGLTALLVPALAPIVGAPAYAVLAYIIQVAEWTAALPLAQVIVPAFPFVLVGLMYGLVALLFWWLKQRRASEARAPHLAPYT